MSVTEAQSAARSTCSAIVDTCLAPYYFIAEKVRALAEAIFGYFLRIITFQLGEINVYGAPTVIRLYQKLISCDPREERPYDPDRLQRSKEFLLGFGGIDTVARPIDGAADVCYCTFKSADFFNRFQAMGAQLIDVNHEGRARRAFLNVSPEIAAKFYFPVIDITLLDGSIQKGVLLPDVCTSPNPPHVVHFHSPGRSMYMDRKLIGQFLGAGYDLTVSDLRGTAESTGSPSEAGYYADADAVLQSVLAQPNAPQINRIYASGFCEGAAVAAHLKQKYHDQGINYIACNPYTSMREVVEGYGFWGRMAARYGMQALFGHIPGIAADGFDNVAKLRNLPRSTGKCVFVHTDTDTMMPRGSVSRMIEAFDRAGPVHEILRRHPNPDENGHMQPPFEDPLVWRRVVQCVN
jgi:dienelactone hydrolase